MQNWKRIVTIVLVLALLSCNMVFVNATNQGSEILYFNDGSYMIVTLKTGMSRAGNTISADKIYTYYNAFDIEQWSATLSASFTFDGTEYWTTSSNVSVDITNSNWYVISKSASMSGCGATADVTMGNKVMGITIDRQSVTLTLSCSPYGVIS